MGHEATPLEPFRQHRTTGLFYPPENGEKRGNGENGENDEKERHTKWPQEVPQQIPWRFRSQLRLGPRGSSDSQPVLVKDRDVANFVFVFVVETVVG